MRLPGFMKSRLRNDGFCFFLLRVPLILFFFFLCFEGGFQRPAWAGFEIEGVIPIELYNAYQFYSGGNFNTPGRPFSDDGQTLIGTLVPASDDQAVRWTASEGLTYLGDLYGGRDESAAAGMSADGTIIVGSSWSSFAASDAYRWSAAGGMIRLGDLPSGAGKSTALAISEDGSVIGGYMDPNGGGRLAFIWTDAAGYTDLGDLGAIGSCEARDLSADGSVVVGICAAEGFKWTAAGGMVGLGDLPGFEVWSEAEAISADGSVIVGTSSVFSTCDGYCANSTLHAFRWTEQEGMVDLGWIPGPSDHSSAFAVSKDGSVILGRSGSSSGYFIWTAEAGMADFGNYLTNATSLDLSEWNLIPMDVIGDPGNLSIIGVGRKGTEDPVIWRFRMSGAMTLDAPAVINENQGVLQGTITLEAAGQSDVTVLLTSNSPDELLLPASVVILSGQASANFDITVIDDALLDGTQSVTITATAAEYAPAQLQVAVDDNETAAISLTIPETANEGNGVIAGAGQVSIDRNAEKDVTIYLSSDRSDVVQVPASVTVLSGAAGASFDLTVVDDGIIDGAQTATITASVAGWTPGADSIAVQDNESSQLGINVPTSVNEADGVLANAGSVWLAAPYSLDLTIGLSSDDPARVAVPSNVTIPAGQTTAHFDLAITDNTVPDGSHTVRISASAAGFTSQSDDVLVAENDLHHFAISAIGNGQAGIPFAVTITAQDANNNSATGYTGTATLSAGGDGGAVAIQPAVTGAFTNGQWTGNVTILAIDTAITLVADDGLGHIATSNSFAVTAGPLDHFGLSAVASPQTVGASFSLTVTAQDALGFTAAGFGGSVNLSAASGAGSEVIVGNGTSSWSYPMYTYYHDARTQVIYTADEIGGAGLIKAVALDVTSLPGQTMNNWTIRMKHTVLDDYSSSPAWESGWTVVYQHSETIAGTGWVVFTLQTPFDYNGTDNLMVDFSFNNSSWSSYGNCRYTLKSQLRSLYFNTDSGYGDPLAWTGTSSPVPRTSYYVPNLKILTDSDIALQPAVSGSFVNGVWTGDITILQTAAGIQIRAEDGLQHTGASNVFDVTILDTDADGLADALENDPASCTDAANPDTDGDGLADGVEDANQNGVVDAGETSPCLADTDGDGLDDDEEAGHGSDPLVADTDNDAINDGDEVLLYGTRPDLADTDGDGLDDGAELTYWGAAWDQDIDGDGLINLLDTDADGDGTADGVEISLGTDPGNPGSIPNQCANPSLPPISAYPYTQGFESGWGDWVNVTGDMFDWARLSGATSSSGTGPSGAAEGQYYAYTESSSPNYPGKTAILAGPRFDLNGFMQGALTFSYHMYGSAMGTLSVQVSTDGCNSWETVWSVSGDQGNSWHSAIVDLDLYSGQTISIRFHGLTGSSYTSDMCIDDLRVDAVPAIPCNIDADCDDGLFCNGIETCVGQICQPGSNPCPGQSCNEDLGICEEAECTTDPECDDGNACTMDSCGEGVCLNEYTNLVDVFPYNESFETGLGAWSNVAGDTFDWTRQSGSTSSYYTGPSGAFSGAYYLYTESSSPNYPGKTALFEGPNFDLTNAAQPQMSFYYHMYGSSMGTLSVEISTNCQVWTSIWSISGDQGDSWHQAGIDLSAYAGQVITIRFRGLTGSSYTSDMSIDNITVNAD